MLQKSVLTDRTMSSFPVSIGTGIMLETLFDPTAARYDNDREIPKRVNVDNYKYHVFNIYTLIRNILASCSYPNKDEILTDKYFIDVLFDELYVLENLYSDTKCKIVFFSPDYTKVCSGMNLNKPVNNTKDYLLYNTLLALFKKIKYPQDLTVIRDVYALPTFEKNTLITTSYPVDLLNKIGSLTMLESHTGKLKEKYDWYTKYHKIGSKPMNIFPFLEELVYVLGEGNLIVPCKLGLRVELHKIATDSNWTTRTSRDRVLYDIKRLSKELYDIVINYKKLY